MINKLQDIGSRAIFGKEKITKISSFYEIIDKDMSGDEVSMSTFKGYPLCIVNVASFWGLTKQNYTEFSKLIDEYGPAGFKVLAFPCNQFGGQEPGTHKEILDFVEKNFQCSEKFTWFEKGHVNGKKTRDVYSFLKRELPDESDGSTDVRWNFAKFLVDHEGNPVKRFGSKTPPFAMKDDIEALLRKKKEQ